MKKLISFIAGVLMFFCAEAKVYYVNSVTGNNANNGTSVSTPWLDISKINAFSTFVGGDSVLFNRGQTFVGCIKPFKGFSSGRLYFGAYGSGANPLITGFVSVTAWTNLGSNIWESSNQVSLLGDLNMVTINGINTPMGRYPNANAATPWLTVLSHTPASSPTTAGNVVGTITSSTALPASFTGGDVVTKAFNFAIIRYPITSQSGNTVTYSANNSNIANDGWGFFIENNVLTLDQQNEWYYNPSTKKIRIYSTATPSNIKVATLDTLVDLRVKSNFVFDGLDFTGSNRRAFYMGSVSNTTIKNCNFDNHGLYAIWGGSNHGANSDKDSIYNCTFMHTNSQVIVAADEYTNLYIGHNYIGISGAFYGMFKVPYVNNGTQSNWAGAFGGIVLADADGTTIEYNKIDTSGYNGITFKGNNIKVHHNEVMHHNYTTQDGGGIYSQGFRTSGGGTYVGCEIHDNIVHDGIGNNSGTNNTSSLLSQGIYCDENTVKTRVYNNSCFNNPSYGIFSNSNTDCYFDNNTCYGNGLGQLLAASKGRVVANVAEREIRDTLTNNIFVSRGTVDNILPWAAEFQSRYTTIDSFFNKINDNIYARPVADNITIFNTLNTGSSATFSRFTLAQWKTYALSGALPGGGFQYNSGGGSTVGKDQAATKSPVALSSLSDLSIEYNATSATVVRVLTTKGVTIRNVSFDGSITLPPYTSEVLLKTGNATAGGVTPASKIHHNNIIR